MCVNIRFVCFHSGAAVLRPIGEQYRVLCASVNSHIFFLSNIPLYISAFSAAIIMYYINFLSFLLYDIYQLFIDFFSQPVHRKSYFRCRYIPFDVSAFTSALQLLHIISTIKDTATTHAHLIH